MPEKLSFLGLVALLLLGSVVPADAADVHDVARCQKKIASAGANFAKKVIRFTLKCTTAESECDTQCEGGVFGVCDTENPGDNLAYSLCLADAEATCLEATAKIQVAEVLKKISIVNACNKLTNEQLCGGIETRGLNFGVLTEGCEEIVPGYTCTLLNLLDCVGGIREQRLAEQIAQLLTPSATARHHSPDTDMCIVSGD